MEMDACYIKGMLVNPDIQLSASINQWILSILTFHFDLVHVKGTFHGPNRHSGCPRQPNNPVMDDDDFDFDDWINNACSFLHVMQPLPRRNFVGLTGAQI